MSDLAVLDVVDLRKHFPVRSPAGGSTLLKAVDGVSITIDRGEVLGLVGESGSGKSTIGKCVMRLLDSTSGRILLDGKDVTALPRRKMRPLRRTMHMVFQDPYSSLNPRMTNGEIVAQPLRLHGIARGRGLQDAVASMFDRVGLRAELQDRYPHELSGGQRQRVALARALILEPSLLIADEPLSALDVSVRASVLNLLMRLQKEMGFSCLFITHDLSTLEVVADRVAVMYLGQLAEVAASRELFAQPKHPYTQALLSAVPVPHPGAQRNRRRVVLDGDLPSPVDPPEGCTFHTRCPVAEDRCRVEEPELRAISSGRSVRCHLVSDEGRAPDIGMQPERLSCDGR